MENTIKNGSVSVVKFGAAWCAPCKVMGETINKMKPEFEGFVNFVSVDVDDSPNLSKNYSIKSVPTVILFSASGKEETRLIGSVKPDVLRKALKDLLDKKAA